MEEESIIKNIRSVHKKSHYIQVQEISGMGFW